MAEKTVDSGLHMENRYMNRYRTYCRSMKRLEKSRSANISDDFVLEGTVWNFCLAFDLAWKVMKDLIVDHFEIMDFTLGSPREVLRKAFEIGLISDDLWLEILKTRNHLAHDYDGTLAEREFCRITHEFYDLMEVFRVRAMEYYQDVDA